MMLVTYTAWDDDHLRPISVKTVGGYLAGITIGRHDLPDDWPGFGQPQVADLGVPQRPEQVRLSFSNVGASCDIDIGQEEWTPLKNRIDNLFNQEDQ